MDASNAPGQSQYLSSIDLLLMLAENARLLIIVPLTAALLGLGLAFAWPPTFTSVTRILPPLQTQNSAASLLANQVGTLTGIVGGTPTLKNLTDVYVSMLKSRTVADQLLKQFKLRELYDEKYDEDARRELAYRTKVTAGKDGIIVIEVEDRDPRRAAEMANAYVSALKNLTQTLAVTEAALRRVFFEGQLNRAKDGLTKSELALRGSGISEASLKAVPQSALEALARLKAQVTAQEVRLAAMRGFMTESNPEYILAQQELAALRVQLSKTAQIDSRIATSAGAEYIAKFRDFKYHEALFELMAKQYEMARLDEAKEGAIVQVIDEAIPPQRQTRPKKVLVSVVAALAGFVIALTIASARRWLRSIEADSASAQKLRRFWELLGWR